MPDEIKFKPIDERGDRQRALYLALIIILVAILAFGLGRYSKIAEAKTKGALIISEIVIPLAESVQAEGTFVASKNGTRYYYPWCTGVNRIKEGNKIWFQTKEEAEGRGLTLAKNCK